MPPMPFFAVAASVVVAHYVQCFIVSKLSDVNLVEERSLETTMRRG
jgi:hypothetical protein